MFCYPVLNAVKHVARHGIKHIAHHAMVASVVTIVCIASPSILHGEPKKVVPSPVVQMVPSDPNAPAPDLSPVFQPDISSFSIIPTYSLAMVDSNGKGGDNGHHHCGGNSGNGKGNECGDPGNGTNPTNPIPEPGTMGVMLAALAMLGLSYNAKKEKNNE